MGTVDILVNSQGLNIKEPFAEQTVADWDSLFGNNVKGVMLCCREFGKVMLGKGKGKIINVVLGGRRPRGAAGRQRGLLLQQGRRAATSPACWPTNGPSTASTSTPSAPR